MARALLRRALSLSAAAATPRVATFTTSSSSSAVAPLRSPLDDRLLRLLRSEISYLSDRRPPYPPPRSFKSFAVEDRPGEQWVRLRSSRAGAEEVKVEATMFDGATEPPPDDAPLFRRVESLERGPRLHLSLIVEVTRGDRVLGFICSAWPDDLAVCSVLTLKGGGGDGDGGRGGRNFDKMKAGERDAVRQFLKEREVDDELAEFLHDYMANKEKMELLRWLKTVESFIDK
ncbi:uncharacterized protein At2g39795, mitochondrial-like [Phragmites australis]|uniref:uncharacterized protein At2g39795, mitochondrial-like n=1 Tax=Phragmites australis TaxID=29695 RepID=UPI002D77C66E|nr:uncharacterized protein At2g39795, mitochondrial-like [Phragmites australis]XP_062199457.1 uncharacterized protein At2g39795, mitochondrial-like [Phragmites australis]